MKHKHLKLQFGNSYSQNVENEVNNQKVSFIYCVNNQNLFNNSLEYIDSLLIPDGFEIEIISIEGASSITAGYNLGMRESNAKYKVFLHQDVFILNKNFIDDVLNLFKENPKLGMIGLAGCKVIPYSFIWWQSKNKFGKVVDSHTNRLRHLYFNEVEKDYEPVAAVDGLLIATQYDIPWREDLFKGWHFYDMSQSMEFINANYEVGIPRQTEPWVIHNCGIITLDGFYEAREIFIKSYKDLKTKFSHCFDG